MAELQLMIVKEHVVEQLIMIIVLFVMMTLQMIAVRIAWEFGVAVL